MKVRVDFSPGVTTARLGAAANRAQAWLDNEVLKDSTPYVPRVTGELERSGIEGTKIGSGLLVYNKVYAAAQYYGYFEHSKQAHPQATRAWFETAKAIHKRKWVAGTKKIGGGG